MTKPSEVSLSSTTSWLISAGSMIRTACGSSTSRRVCPRPSPIDMRRLALAARQRQDAGAHDLGDDRAVVERQADDQRVQRVEPARRRRSARPGTARG